MIHAVVGVTLANGTVGNVAATYTHLTGYQYETSGAGEEASN